MNYLKMLVDEFHSTVVATLDQQGYPQTRAIDMMLYDEKGIYFLTAKGKAFYQQLIQQNYMSLTALKDKRAISLKGKVKCIHHTYLKEIFQKNTYMQKIYPENTRDILEVFVYMRQQVNILILLIRVILLKKHLQLEVLKKKQDILLMIHVLDV